MILEHVAVSRMDTLQRVLSGCPALEHLLLNFVRTDDRIAINLVIDSPTLRTIEKGHLRDNLIIDNALRLERFITFCGDHCNPSSYCHHNHLQSHDTTLRLTVWLVKAEKMETLGDPAGPNSRPDQQIMDSFAATTLQSIRVLVLKSPRTQPRRSRRRAQMLPSPLA
jgi:hypothetical protein